MPEVSYMYATPYEWYEDYAVRKYGAHGTSHEYVSQEAIKYLGLGKNSKVITCHIGNGASISAVLDGKCLDTSMGFTPLAGVMMGTRTGDIDPAVVPYVMRKANMTAEEVLNAFNKKSGLLGVSGISSDSRDVENAANEGNKRAILAQEMQVRTIVRYVGAYYAELGGCDAIVFTAGLGENNSALRASVCEQLAAFGVKLDAEANKVRGDFQVISSKDSKVSVLVIPTNEELVIARDTVRLLGL
jgi:acetate kinase